MAVASRADRGFYKCRLPSRTHLWLHLMESSSLLKDDRCRRPLDCSQLGCIASALVTISLLGTLATTIQAQTEWKQIQILEERGNAAAAYDSLRDRVVLFGGVGKKFRVLAETLEWDGEKWLEIDSSVVPPERFEHAMVFDPVRRRILMFGGADLDGDPLGDTWEWDGKNWFERDPVDHPAPRRGHAMVWDAVRKRAVLFSGSDGTLNSHADTWEWDGNNWLESSPANSPPPRTWHRMAYDFDRKRAVLFGGFTRDGLVNDTWEWDGQEWQDLSSGFRPPRRWMHGLAWDPYRRRVLVQGGTSSRLGFNDLWEWDGRDWRRLLPEESPPGRYGHIYVSAGKRDGVLWYGGIGDDERARDGTWSWKGGAWLEVDPAQSPPPRHSAALSYDEGRAVTIMYGGLSGFRGDLRDTWEFDGSRWIERHPEHTPCPMTNPVMAYDRAREKTVLVGPSLGTDTETWEWDGDDWQLRQLSVNPPNRLPYFSYGMAYDSVRECMVLFGGTSARETWEYDGNQWSRIDSPNVPSSVSGTVFYDPERQRIVWHDGSETWQWDGNDWSERIFASPPPVAMWRPTYDFKRQRIVLMESKKLSPGVYEMNTWELADGEWLLRATESRPPSPNNWVMEYDQNRGQIVFTNEDGETWIYRAKNQASAEAFGIGCIGTAGVPVLGMEGGDLPWLENTFNLRLETLPSGTSSLPFGILGFSDSDSTLGLLPLDLSYLGMTGCELMVSLDRICPLVNQGGSALWELSVPASPDLIGTQAYVQAGVSDASANALGVVLTNGVKVTIGAK